MRWYACVLVLVLLGARPLQCQLARRPHSKLSTTSAREASAREDQSATKLKTLVEKIYWRQQRTYNRSLAALSPADFTDSIHLPLARSDYGFIRGLFGSKMAPGKYIWDFFRPDYNCPLKERVGDGHPRDGDGGKWVCGIDTLLQKENCVVYSFGSNGQTAFEEGMLELTSCTIHVFDPTLTVEQRQQVERVPGLQLHRYGLGGLDGAIEADGQQTFHRGSLALPVKRLETIMKDLGHTWVDLLKVDIEGSEWAVLEQLLNSGQTLPFTQLQVEFHYWKGSPFTKPKQMFEVLQNMEKKGRLRVFSVEPNIWWGNNGHDFMEYAFIQVDRKGDVITGPL